MNQNQALTYLEDFLRDEFRGQSQVRVRATPLVVAQRAPDMDQDVDESALPSQGVYIKISSREYFFPVEWIMARQFDKVQAEVSEIRNRLNL